MRERDPQKRVCKQVSKEWMIKYVLQLSFVLSCHFVICSFSKSNFLSQTQFNASSLSSSFSNLNSEGFMVLMAILLQHIFRCMSTHSYDWRFLRLIDSEAFYLINLIGTSKRQRETNNEKTELKIKNRNLCLINYYKILRKCSESLLEVVLRGYRKSIVFIFMWRIT